MNDSSNSLQQLLGSRISDAGELTAHDLEMLWHEWLPGSTRAAEAGLRATEDALRAGLGDRAPQSLQWHPGAWVVKLGAPGAKTTIVGALLAGVLVAVGAVGLVPLVVPVVLPMLFDLERVKLSRSEHLIALTLWRHPDVSNGALTSDELYSRLPNDIREHINPLDFMDLIDKLRRAGVAREDERGGVVLTSPDDPRFQVILE